MTKKEAYAEYLKSEHWKALRSQKLSESAECRKCEAEQDLHVHHINYRNWYDCSMDDLMVLCKTCHFSLHNNLDHFKIKPDQCRALGTLYMTSRPLDWDKEEADHKRRMDSTSEEIDDSYDPEAEIIMILADTVFENCSLPDPTQYPSEMEVQKYLDGKYPDLRDEINIPWEIEIMRFDRLHVFSRQWGKIIPVDWERYMEIACNKRRVKNERDRSKQSKLLSLENA